MVTRPATRDGVQGYEIRMRVGEIRAVLWHRDRDAVEQLANKYLQRVARVGKPLTREQVKRAAKRGSRYLVEL